MGGIARGDSDMSRPPNHLIALAGLLLLAALGLASDEEDQILHYSRSNPSNFQFYNKQLQGLKRQRPIYGVSPLSSFQGYFRRPYRNDRLQVIRLKRKDLLQQNNGGSLKVIRL